MQELGGSLPETGSRCETLEQKPADNSIMISDHDSSDGFEDAVER